jgi:hypothetical protein
VKYFPDIKDENIVQTKSIKDMPQPLNPRLDYAGQAPNPNPGHGTIVASKVVGSVGVAKKATVVPVQMHPRGSPLVELLGASPAILGHFAPLKATNQDQAAVSICPIFTSHLS